MNTQHTPGPWAVEVINGAVHSIYTTKPNPEVLEYSEAEIIVETDSGFYPPKLADAHLIAAAPELLEALKEAQLITQYAAGGMTHAAWMTERAVKVNKKVEAAIAKATGAT